MPRVKQSGIALSTFLQDRPPAMMTCPTLPSERGHPSFSPRAYSPSPEERRATETSLRQLPRVRRTVEHVGPLPIAHPDSGSLAAIMVHLRDECVMRGANAVFCDVACGGGQAVFAAAEVSPRMSGSVGLDSDKASLISAQNNATRFQQVWWNGSQYYATSHANPVPEDTPSLNLVYRDLRELDSLGCSTHVYACCRSLPEGGTDHLLRLCAATPTLRYLTLVYDEAEGGVAHEFVKAAKEVTTRVHSFVDDRGRTQLKANGEAVHGCVIRVRSRVRQMLREWADGVAAETPSHPHLGSLPNLWVRIRR